MSENYYIRNKETGKIELHFDKETYMSLPDSDKQKIKSNFLFGRKTGAWISRCKFPNLYRAEEVAKALGLENRGVEGETLTFAEKQERKAERAEARADRYDGYSDNAEKRGEALQRPIEDRHGDIAFFTQPNINTSSGRAFTRQREKMWDAWERGFEEFKKSAYFADRAKTARETARTAKQPESKSFCERRIAEAEKTIRAQRKHLETYKGYLKQIEETGEAKGIYGSKISKERVLECIDRAEEIIEDAISKSIYYHEWIEKMGGINFSKENVKPGYIIKVVESAHAFYRNRLFEVTSTGTKNVHIRDAETKRPYPEISYADIASVVKAETSNEIKHPFKVGDRFVGEVFNFKTCEYNKIPVVVTKVTADKVSVKVGDGRATAYKVRNSYDGKSYYIAIPNLRTWIEKTA